MKKVLLITVLLLVGQFCLAMQSRHSETGIGDNHSFKMVTMLKFFANRLCAVGGNRYGNPTECSENASGIISSLERIQGICNRGRDDVTGGVDFRDDLVILHELKKTACLDGGGSCELFSAMIVAAKYKNGKHMVNVLRHEEELRDAGLLPGSLASMKRIRHFYTITPIIKICK